MVKTLNLREVSTAGMHKRGAALMKSLPPLSGLLRASFVKQYLTCGKKNCRCRRGIQTRAVFLPGAIVGHRTGAEIFIEDSRATEAGARGHRGTFKMAAATGGIVRN